MTTREKVLAVLNYEKYSALPLIHFGYWRETLEKWCAEGYITQELLEQCRGDNSPGEREVSKILGFDFCWSPTVNANAGLFPHFEPRIIEERSDGTYLEFDQNGVIVQKNMAMYRFPLKSVIR